jgi:quercetin dioxygenase-like cupin family protein
MESNCIVDVSLLKSVPLNHKVGSKQVIIANGVNEVIPQIAKAHIDKKCTIEEHQHKDMTEYFYVLEGNCFFIINGIELFESANSFIVIPPATKHSVITKTSSVKLFYWGCLQNRTND